jgi:hypothetical protein
MTTVIPEVEEYEYFIDTPVTSDLFDADEDLARGYGMNYDERQSWKAAAIKEGYEKRAVVVLRDKPPYYRTEPTCWGIVLDVNAIQYSGRNYWAPIEVAWLNGTKSDHYHDELIVCMYAPDDQDIQSIQRGEY